MRLARHVPNLLSALRLLAAPFAAWLILNDHDTAALLVFAACAASDGLDGWIARHWGVTSDFGAWLDPAADKLLMLLCFTALCAIGATPLWLLGLVVMRDASIAVGWLLVKMLGLPLSTRPLLIGKISTVVQLLYVLVLLLLLAFNLEAPRLSEGGAWICAVFTLLSGLAYAVTALRTAFGGRRVA
ncbi:MAG: CDP-alcohol phosphatidyltransferase family protein [Alphaproteobacteria bacterium]|nr:CDP-alcohol phosphatidyltransferase family protein [Alphaproteobacteria bacterium]